MAKVPVIKAVNLAKEFQLGTITVQALKSVNLEIYSGEFIIFFGPSGCGKSTLMSMIAGLQPPSTGKVYIRGEDISTYTENQLAEHRRTKIGMVFQAFNLIPSMTVLENIALPLAFARIDKKRRLQRAENLLDVVGMGEYKKHTPVEMSGGQQQRIAIARSMVANPWIMLADEPTGNLDSKSANEVMRLLISLNRKSKRTIILITHNPDYLDYADRIFYLRDGKVVDTRVNAKVKSIDEVAKEGVRSDDLSPAAREAAMEEAAKAGGTTEGGDEEVVEEKPEKGKKKSKKAEKDTTVDEAPVAEDVTSDAPVDGSEEVQIPDAEEADENPVDVGEEAAPEEKKSAKLKPMKLGK
jgi:putative ABC transport system ATP-binding protein